MPGALIDRPSIILEIRKAHALQLTDARRSGDAPSGVTSHHDVWLQFAASEWLLEPSNATLTNSG